MSAKPKQSVSQTVPCNNQKPPVHSSLVSGTRDFGTGNAEAVGDLSGLACSPTNLDSMIPQPSKDGGGTTKLQPGDLHPDANVAKRLCVRPQKLDWHPPVEREDRLASTSRSRRHRIMRKRPPNADEGISAKRLKLDTG